MTACTHPHTTGRSEEYWAKLEFVQLPNPTIDRDPDEAEFYWVRKCVRVTACIDCVCINVCAWVPMHVWGRTVWCGMMIDDGRLSVYPIPDTAPVISV